MEFTKGLIVFFVIFVLPIGIYLQCFTESVFIFNPLIDTKLPPGFTLQKFDSIKPGMSKAEVSKILSAPRYSSDDGLSWRYGEDGAAPFGDFAWFEFTIHFDEAGKVMKTERQTFHD
ncbi:hypothetical protein H6G74_26285 [Nostoc spongiaeforme FACHB-130]|uniref:Lipoprotein SmpA/OmlA domain-containing protein n=1 Tax=Nostoc spongiaeforme FACHB-130 TaxID=1357510 RepID=A0ABR8G3I8_9NOSO|nr:hypothetical protein [Nostoc spongiaeforme]MBD2597806.1 hypothetical protein [Nostoc spongiaeforme FACHB-130]